MSEKQDGGGPYGPALNIQKVNNVGGITPEIWIRGDNIGAPGSTYPDGTAPASALGCVKAGKNITIDTDGTINATGGSGPTTVDWKDVQNKPSTFPVAAATASAIGGVKPGKNLTVQADGTLDASGGSIVPATPTVLGGVKIGQGLNITGDGLLSTQDAIPNWSDIQNKPATFPVAIATAGQLGGVKQGRGINIEADGTINTEAAAPEWDEIIKKPAVFPPPIASTNTLGGVKQGAGVKISGDGTLSADIQQVDWDIIVDKPKAFPPTIAEEGKVGGVKPGNNISIDPDGTINAAAVDLPIASTYLLGGVKVGAGLTIAEDGTLGTEASAPYWLDIVDKPKAFPPTNASEGVVGGIMPDSNFKIAPDGMISAKPFTGIPFLAISYDGYGNIGGNPTVTMRNGNLILGGVAPVQSADGSAGEEVQFGGAVTLLDPTGAYQAVIRNDSFDYNLLLSNGPNIKAGFLPFVTQVENADVSLSFGPAKDAIGYATKDKIGLAQVGKNIDVDKSGVVSVKTATKDDLGVVRVGGGIDVNDGVITPSLATFASPGIVQAGNGLEIDKNGVLSVVNPIAFVNRKEFDWAKNYAGEFFWVLPDGVEYFRVTVIGQGGWGAKAGGNANENTGGGGGGGGGWVSALFYGYKFPKGQSFNAYFTSVNSTYPNSAGDARFGIDSKTQPFIVGCGGGHGEPGNSAGAVANGFAHGGSGGQIDLGKSSDQFIITGYGTGQRGGDGFRTHAIKDATSFKAIGGDGGMSTFSGYTKGILSGYGGGAAGCGDNTYGATSDITVVGGRSAVIIEW